MSELDFSPPDELTISLWRSLLLNVLDRLSPERLPPLQLTSKPVDVGILVGDLVDLPWYRTVFTNLGDVISPETLPPLELESRPVDVGELLGDDLSRGWWDTLLASLRDRLAPEKLPPLNLTSQPVAVFGAESSLQLLDWSALISTPKVFLQDAPRQDGLEPDGLKNDAPREEVLTSRMEEAAQPTVPLVPKDPVLWAVRLQLARDLGRTRFRRRIWIGLAAAEAVFLIVAMLRFT
jgi:hypothetical protein